MPDDEITRRITHAWRKLQAARAQGCAIQQLYWNGELDRQLEEYAQHTEDGQCG